MAKYTIYGTRDSRIGDLDAKLPDASVKGTVEVADEDWINLVGDCYVNGNKYSGETDYWGRFSYKDGWVKGSSRVTGFDVDLDDGSFTVYVDNIYLKVSEIEDAAKSNKHLRAFTKELFESDDEINRRSGGGSLFARTHSGNDNIDVHSGMDNDIDSGSGDDEIMVWPGVGGIFLGGDDNDKITNWSSTAEVNGCRGNDTLKGNTSANKMRGGNGRDILTGGYGGDYLYGDFGLNTFTGEKDGYEDNLYIKSDHLAYNHIYGKAGNSPNGEKADKIGELDTYDKIFIQGADTSQLSFGHVDHASALGITLSGTGIYADGVLEAVYVGSNLTSSDIKSMTSGAPA